MFLGTIHPSLDVVFGEEGEEVEGSNDIKMTEGGRGEELSMHCCTSSYHIVFCPMLVLTIFTHSHTHIHSCDVMNHA